MKTEKIMVEFTQDEIDDLIDEMIGMESLLSNATDMQIRELHKDESEDVQDMFVNLHKGRVRFANEIINKLAPHSTFLNDEAIANKR